MIFVYALSGSDYASKFGTKKPALYRTCLEYLGVSSDWSDIEQKYLVKLLQIGSLNL